MAAYAPPPRKPRAPSPLVRWLVALVVALSLAACDSGDLTGPDPAGSTPTVDTPPSDGVTFSPLPTGASLFAGGPAGVSNGSGSARQATRYGCYFSTPNPGGPPDERYLIDRTAADFPREVTDRAGGQTRVVQFLIGSETAYTEGTRSAPVVVRQARCVIPDDAEAQSLLREALVPDAPAGGVDWEGEPMTPISAGSATEGTSQNRLASISRTASVSSSCNIYVIRQVWASVCSGPLNGETNCTLTMTEEYGTRCSLGGGSGISPGGSGGSSPGPGSDPCDNGQVMGTGDQEGLGCGELGDGEIPEGTVFLFPGEGGATPITPWDIADWAALGISISDFYGDRTWANAGWALLDLAAAILPVMPSPGLFRHSTGILARRSASLNRALQTAPRFVRAANGAKIPIPKGFVGRRADSGTGVVFQKPGAPSAGQLKNRDSIRIMDPVTGHPSGYNYPEGYVVYYGPNGNPLDRHGIGGKPRAEYHHDLRDSLPPGLADFFNRLG